jgi:hypothetical protein
VVQVWATLTQHDSVIFRDNDFEIFVNAVRFGLRGCGAAAWDGY